MTRTWSRIRREAHKPPFEFSSPSAVPVDVAKTFASIISASYERNIAEHGEIL